MAGGKPRPLPQLRAGVHANVYRAAIVLNAVIAWTRQLSDTP
ncbi:hypothetical protein [Mycolicibacterium moriokaense]|nr:hypothetical protein [Mycolicibacterium moriokaense]